jgi:hypothetical protein
MIELLYVIAVLDACRQFLCIGVVVIKPSRVVYLLTFEDAFLQDSRVEFLMIYLGDSFQRPTCFWNRLS